MRRTGDSIVSVQARIRKPHLCSIGRNSIIDDFCYVSCALELGDFSHIGANCTIIGGSGKVTIGNFVNIAPGTRIICASHDYLTGGLSGPCIPAEFQGHSITEDVFISDHVLLGCNTVILPGVRLPVGFASGAMTLLDKRDYLGWWVYIGSPPRRYKRRMKFTVMWQAERLMNEPNIS